MFGFGDEGVFVACRGSCGSDGGWVREQWLERDQAERDASRFADDGYSRGDACSAFGAGG